VSRHRSSTSDKFHRLQSEFEQSVTNTGQRGRAMIVLWDIQSWIK
jgi:hypothetical protein